MIEVADSKEFSKLISGLSNDVVDAHIHWRLHCDLVDAIQKQEAASGLLPIAHLLASNDLSARIHRCRKPLPSL